jgi:group I intron endonuclease
VGQSIDPHERWRKHICDAERQTGKTSQTKKFAFQNALAKYSKENFEWQIIESTTDKEQANELEQFYIAYLNTLVPNGYNLESGGMSHDIHASTRKKISETLKKTSSLIGKSGKDHPAFGKKPSQEQRDTRSKRLSGEGGPNVKLTSEDVVLIYKLGLEGMNTSEIQARMNIPVKQVAILNILHKRSWKKQLESFPEIDFSKLSRRYESKPKPIRKHKTKFTHEQIEIICSCLHTSSTLGDMFGVDAATIRNVRQRLCSKKQLSAYKQNLKRGLIPTNKKVTSH